MKTAKTYLTALGIAGVLIGGPAQAGLKDRGTRLAYDDVLDVTSLIDANYAWTKHYAFNLGGRLS
jgi:hypothetical protein